MSPWAAAALLLLAGCATMPDADSAKLERFEYEQPQMGVPFRMVLYAPDEAAARNAAEAAFARIAELNSLLSDYETDSELSVLSRSSEQGSPETRVSSDLWRILEASQAMARETDGVFDITLGPCVALWRKARREKQMPDPARLEAAREKVGYENLVLNPKNQSAKLLRFGMRLDLGAIAKGYAADEALKTLRARGINRALVAASGDIAAGDPPPCKKGWTIEIIGYDRPGGPPSGRAILANGGVATSGDLFQRVEINGVRYSHILDAATCLGMTNHALATVIAQNCFTADRLATACAVLEGEAALKLAARHGAAARIVAMKGEAPAATSNWRFERMLKE